MKLPVHSLSLMHQVYRHIMPAVHEELAYWKKRALDIPNKELREQALASIEHKKFHCEGGAIMALTALGDRDAAIKFIVAYQTISDYLDNLCDRSTSLNPQDFKALHESMMDAVTVDALPQSYYRFRDDQDDGGYLLELMRTCQSVLGNMPHYVIIMPYLHELCQYYCELQIHKHVCIEEREERLKGWYEENKHKLPEMSWYEFSACSGSTLGIFGLVSYALRSDFKASHAEMIRNGYFPYIQGLHILLDYFIDQDEDRAEGDLNFCFYYESNLELSHRLIYFLQQADQHTLVLPDRKFHKLINRGLLGVYLSDRKVNEQKEVRALSKKVMRQGGKVSYFFYWNGRAYRWLQQRFFIEKSLLKNACLLI
ncbi:tetraprenyl-beta-curcumene synthase family protein [Sporosarcina beigongshangi]|uniref:tetraprenyl-beta-curcumene synthase family protein n=1 Tax=Sporosarcina beigongshangi TaxID=2782538 RepID=UPI001939F884|nr:tetraprenyl-beta-curcumene synthase family protein [Sporosarcina beigongshangi]